MQRIGGSCYGDSFFVCIFLFFSVGPASRWFHAGVPKGRGFTQSSILRHAVFLLWLNYRLGPNYEKLGLHGCHCFCLLPSQVCLWWKSAFCPRFCFFCVFFFFFSSFLWHISQPKSGLRFCLSTHSCSALFHTHLVSPLPSATRSQGELEAGLHAWIHVWSAFNQTILAWKTLVDYNGYISKPKPVFPVRGALCSV